MIAGPVNAICDECVDLCVEVPEEELGDDWRSPQ
jgi:ATP-dependent protease Clp ATPase subunit